jgi:hypothetical protein
MKLEDIARLLPGADLRVKVERGGFLVIVRHRGKTGRGEHRELTFATRRAMLSLQ